MCVRLYITTSLMDVKCLNGPVGSETLFSNSFSVVYVSDGSNNRNRNTTACFLTTTTQLQPRFFFSTTAHILRNFYTRKSLFYLC